MKLEITTTRDLNGCYTWQVRLGNLTIGSATAVPKPDLVAPDKIYIANVGIVAAFQARGFGKKLVERIVRDLEKEPLPAYLKVDINNGRARHIYAKMGGVESDSGQATHVFYWWGQPA